MPCSMYRSSRGVVPIDIKTIGAGAKCGMGWHTPVRMVEKLYQLGTTKVPVLTVPKTPLVQDIIKGLLQLHTQNANII